MFRSRLVKARKTRFCACWRWQRVFLPSTSSTPFWEGLFLVKTCPLTNTATHQKWPEHSFYYSYSASVLFLCYIINITIILVSLAATMTEPCYMYAIINPAYNPRAHIECNLNLSSARAGVKGCTTTNSQKKNVERGTISRKERWKK